MDTVINCHQHAVAAMNSLVDDLVSLLLQSIHDELQSPLARRSRGRDPVGPHYAKPQLPIASVSEFNRAPGNRNALMC